MFWWFIVLLLFVFSCLFCRCLLLLFVLLYLSKFQRVGRVDLILCFGASLFVCWSSLVAFVTICCLLLALLCFFRSSSTTVGLDLILCFGGSLFFCCLCLVAYVLFLFFVVVCLFFVFFEVPAHQWDWT